MIDQNPESVVMLAGGSMNKEVRQNPDEIRGGLRDCSCSHALVRSCAPLWCFVDAIPAGSYAAVSRKGHSESRVHEMERRTRLAGARVGETCKAKCEK